MKAGFANKISYYYLVFCDADVDKHLENKLYIIIWLLQNLLYKYQEMTDPKFDIKVMINDI